MTEPEESPKLGRYVENVPLLLTELSQQAVKSASPKGMRRISEIYYNPTSKRLRVILKKE